MGNVANPVREKNEQERHSISDKPRDEKDMKLILGNDCGRMIQRHAKDCKQPHQKQAPFVTIK